MIQVPVLGALGPGSSDVTVVALAEFFLGHRPGERTVYAEFVRQIAP